MIQTVFVPMSYKMSQEQAFLLQAQGNAEKVRAKWVEERESAEESLNRLIEEGWSLFHSGQIEDANGVSFVYVLHKADDLVDAELKSWLTETYIPTTRTTAKEG